MYFSYKFLFLKNKLLNIYWVYQTLESGNSDYAGHISLSEFYKCLSGAFFFNRRNFKLNLREVHL